MFYQENEIVDALRCPSCHLKFTDPRIIPCGHTYCNDCIEILRKKDDGYKFICIECQEEHVLIPSMRFPVNLCLMKLIEKKPNEVIQSKSVVELKKALNLLIKGIETLQSNFDNRNLDIREHCSKLRRDVELNTELHIEKIQAYNEKLIKEINDYEKKCVSRYEESIVKEPNSIENLLKESRKFTEEKRKYLAGFYLNDEEIENSLNSTKEYLDKLNKETPRLDAIKFNGVKKTFRANFQEFDPNILGSIVDDKVIIYV